MKDKSLNTDTDMEILATFDVMAHKYYQQHSSNDYYYIFNEEERKELRDFIEISESFRDIVKYYISNNGEYHGTATVNEIRTEEKEDELFIIVKAHFTNEDNYAADKMTKIIKDTSIHYFTNASISYGKDYYYRCKTCTGRQKKCANKKYHKKQEKKAHKHGDRVEAVCPDCPVEGVKSDHEHDYEKCGVELCNQGEAEMGESYHFNIWMVEIEVGECR